ncbi:DUF3461 family protein [Arsenophonus endosymbiont of Bemisia tabaci]|uniref:DUF3461 family protein n=1 Tax=Arsenophonus endosymbiont of Bemisia tabaci TaxID=536059 RepID=UPI0015F6FAC1|nr:DUF3461 family protein [Arsenophonus endosymbiont of Bemisia tabaci]
MYDNLKSLGITQPEDIDHYTFRQEANHEILKIYFRKDKDEHYAKSVKFKYPLQRKLVNLNNNLKKTNEINLHLRDVIEELNQIYQHDQSNHDLKSKILNDLGHLESVVISKIGEIKSDLKKLS